MHLALESSENFLVNSKHLRDKILLLIGVNSAHLRIFSLLIKHDRVVILILAICMCMHIDNYCHDNWDLKTGTGQYQENIEANIPDIMACFMFPLCVLKKKKKKKGCP